MIDQKALDAAANALAEADGRSPRSYAEDAKIAITAYEAARPRVGREALAKLIALAGLGTTDGRKRKPPNDKWEPAAWADRILEVIPSLAELRCYELADAILQLQESGRG